MEGDDNPSPVIYDATLRLRHESLMDTVDVLTLAYGDVIMADCLAVQDPNDGGWDVSFEYTSMAVIVKAPV
ncbi:hypothetical protein TRAPUB_4912 [Trametes pubescens]|uniref:Uncharacterized protein n=1 Tax=Trametes pubescens TaxID=154538 RepID=A0A1M2V9Y3_TRAPU|nr:hypothetical protein TRAPUB_4912 [Trametes pubescens]